MGKYNDQEGSSSTCEGTCPAGWASKTSSTPCIQCDAGQYQDKDVSQVWGCKGCQPGLFGVSATSPCGLCPQGYYQPNHFVLAYTVGQCKACEEGKYGPNSGSPNCTDFPAGTFFDGKGATGISSGSLCPAGYYSGAGAKKCKGCPAGYFGDEDGGISIKQACILCHEGEYQPSAGKQTCKTCTVGYASPRGTPPVNSCSECVGGQYQDLVQATSYGCKSCVPGECYSVPGMISYFSFDGFF